MTEQPNTVTCPSCQGAGSIKIRPAVPPRGLKVSSLPCTLCHSTGRISEEASEWVKMGEIIRNDRRSRRMTHHKEAAERGVSVGNLCAMEEGRTDPTEYMKKHGLTPPR